MEKFSHILFLLAKDTLGTKGLHLVYIGINLLYILYTRRWMYEYSYSVQTRISAHTGVRIVDVRECIPLKVAHEVRQRARERRPEREHIGGGGGRGRNGRGGGEGGVPARVFSDEDAREAECEQRHVERTRKRDELLDRRALHLAHDRHHAALHVLADYAHTRTTEQLQYGENRQVIESILS